MRTSGSPVSPGWTVASAENLGRVRLIPGLGASGGAAGTGLGYWAKARPTSGGAADVAIATARRQISLLMKEDELACIIDPRSAHPREIDAVGRLAAASIAAVPRRAPKSASRS